MARKGTVTIGPYFWWAEHFATENYQLQYPQLHTVDVELIATFLIAHCHLLTLKPVNSLLLAIHRLGVFAAIINLVFTGFTGVQHA